MRLDAPTPVAHAVVPPGETAFEVSQLVDLTYNYDIFAAHSSELGPVEVALSDVTSPEPKDEGLGPVPAAISDKGLGPVPAAISDEGLGPVPAAISDEGLGPVPKAVSHEEFATSLGPEPTAIITFVSPPGPTPFSPGPIPLSPEFIPPEIGPEPISLESPELVSEQSGAKKTSGKMTCDT